MSRSSFVQPGELHLSLDTVRAHDATKARDRMIALLEAALSRACAAGDSVPQILVIPIDKRQRFDWGKEGVA